MRQKLLKGMVAAVAMLGGALSLSAAIPENLYMCGPATTVRWAVENGVEFTNEGNGVFTWQGVLYRSDMIFTLERNWDANRIAPKVHNSKLTDSNAEIVNCVKGGAEFENHWITEGAGVWSLKVTFTDDGNTVKIDANMVSPAPYVIPLGAGPNQWNSGDSANSIMYEQENAPGTYVWEGALTPANSQHFKFITCIGEWNMVDFYLPASTDEGSNVKTVELGQEYPVIKGWDGNGNLETYWSLPQDKCLPFKSYKVTLNLNNNTVKFEGGDQTYFPEQLYFTGDATPVCWNFMELTKKNDRTFCYTGNLYEGRLRFLDKADFSNSYNYVPRNESEEVGNANAENCVQFLGDSGRNWLINQDGEWSIVIAFSEDGNYTMVAERLGDTKPCLYAMGGCSGHWETRWSNPRSYMMPEENNENLFVWKGTLTGQDECKHFKFIDNPKNEFEKINFYVPAEVDYNNNVKLVELGQTYNVQKVAGTDEANRDHFWGFAADNVPTDPVKVTVDTRNNTIKFEKDLPSGIETVGTDTQLKARFIGDVLVVEGAGAGVAVYDISGRKVAEGNGDALTVNGLANGIYVVRTADAAVKIAK